MPYSPPAACPWCGAQVAIFLDTTSGRPIREQCMECEAKREYGPAYLHGPPLTGEPRVDGFTPPAKPMPYNQCFGGRAMEAELGMLRKRVQSQASRIDKMEARLKELGEIKLEPGKPGKVTLEVI